MVLLSISVFADIFYENRLLLKKAAINSQHLWRLWTDPSSSQKWRWYKVVQAEQSSSKDVR